MNENNKHLNTDAVEQSELNWEWLEMQFSWVVFKSKPKHDAEFEGLIGILKDFYDYKLHDVTMTFSHLIEP